MREGKNLGSLVSRTLILLEDYGPATLNEAVNEAFERETLDFGALCALCERRRQRQKHHTPPSAKVAFGAHVTDSEVRQHALEDYDER